MDAYCNKCIFRIVNYVNCNKDEYFTIGYKGVCHFCAGEEIEYTKLERWEQEYKLYLKLIKVIFYCLIIFRQK